MKSAAKGAGRDGAGARGVAADAAALLAEADPGRYAVASLDAGSDAAPGTPALAAVDPDAALGVPALPNTALHGLLGDAVRALAPHTEAHPAGVLLSLLVGAGVLLGRGPHQVLGPGARVGCNLFGMLCGPTGRGRKGMATGAARALLDFLDPAFGAAHVVGGLHSAEGLVHRMRDARPGLDGTADGKGADPGVADKRCWAVVEEWGAAMKRMKGEGNTLSMTLREAWDGRDLEVLTKGQPERATAPHFGLVAHVTPDELRRLLNVGDVLNGLLNRFLFAYVEAARALPFGGADVADVFAPGAAAGDVAAALGTALATGRARDRVDLTPAGAEWWQARYLAELRFSPYEGQLGALTDRGAALVRRVALVYAVADGRAAVDVADLDAALGVWRYSLASVVRSFGPALLSARARRLLGALADSGAAGLPRAELAGRGLGSKAYTAADLDAALGELAALDVAHATEEPTAGRPRTVWRHVRYRAAASQDGRDIGGKGSKSAGAPDPPHLPYVPTGPNPAAAGVLGEFGLDAA